jgi:hypothetical protein
MQIWVVLHAGNRTIYTATEGKRLGRWLGTPGGVRVEHSAATAGLVRVACVTVGPM